MAVRETGFPCLSPCVLPMLSDVHSGGGRGAHHSLPNSGACSTTEPALFMPDSLNTFTLYHHLMSTEQINESLKGSHCSLLPSWNDAGINFNNGLDIPLGIKLRVREGARKAEAGGKSLLYNVPLYLAQFVMLCSTLSSPIQWVWGVFFSCRKVRHMFLILQAAEHEYKSCPPSPLLSPYKIFQVVFYYFF